MVDVTNDLGVAVLQDYAYTRSNFAFSPYGVASVLVVLYEGARGEAARQIHNTLRLPWNVDVTRIGFRDIHRHLRGYFSHEGYLSGLSLNKNHTSLLPEYRRILRFYGYDVGLAPGDSFPPTKSTTPATATTTTSKPTEGVGSTPDTTENTTTDAKGTVTESAATTEGTDAPSTSALSDETTNGPQDNTEKVSISATTMPPEAGFTSTTLTIQTESTNSPGPSDDETVTTGDVTSATESGTEQEFTPMLDTTTESVPRAQANGATTLAEVTSTVVLGEALEEPASTVPHEITEQTTQTAGPPKGLTEATIFAEQSTENVTPRVPPGTVPPIEQATETIAPTEQPAVTVTATEEVSERVTLIEQPTTVESVETLVPTEQPAETVVPTERPGDAVAQTEQPTETAVPTERPGDAVAQTESEDKMTETGQQTEREVPTEQPAGAEQIEVVVSIEQRPETLTTKTVADIANNTIPDDATEQASSTEIDSGSSIVTNDEALVQSMSRFREVRWTVGTSFPLAYNLSSPATSENTTLESRNRTRRSIEDSMVVFPDISLQLQNGMSDSQLSRGFELYTQLPKRPFLVDGVSEELVPVMTYTMTFRFAYIQRLHAQALEFPLDDERYRLLLLLPVEKRGLRQLIYDLTSCPLRQIYQALRYTRVQAVIPSFMVEGSVILTPTLQQLGIWDVFDPRRANLSGMSNDPELYVRNIEQSVTVVIRNYIKILDIQTRTMAARAATERFVVTHPFLYFVLDTDTHIALMAGKIVDPLNSRIY
ncbi:hypothetical protein B7P43_G09054 [Cryptotermes secundus]|nr:mucin-5AC [Cryptotermes secundus]PNF15851.1 hypothetical protein B7P43_G09054 [Cryptotermes secundus]